jgi:hypothetical protein
MSSRTLRTLFNGKRSRLVSWIACLAMLVAALAPALSHALSPVGHAAETANAVEVCTMAGMQLVMLDADGGKIKTPLHKSAAMADCPYCASHANAIGLRPNCSPVLSSLAPIALAPALFYQAARPLYAWAPAQSRAPPAG